MGNLKRYLAFSTVYLVVLVFAIQAPFYLFQYNSPTSHGFVQPDSSDFSRWVKNPGQYQNNGENCPGFGLIPAPVDLSIVACKNPVIIPQPKMIAPQVGKRQFVFL
jgi:hypothetical protein